MAEEEVEDFHGGNTTFEQEGDYIGPNFDLLREIKVAGGDTPPSEPWMPCERLHGVPLVRSNSVANSNMGLHLLSGVCPW